MTYVSRGLPPASEGGDEADGFDRALQRLDLDSNYELIRTLDPLVGDHARGGYVQFARALREAIAAHLPALDAHKEAILSYLVLYYGVEDGPELTPPSAATVAPAEAPPAPAMG